MTAFNIHPELRRIKAHSLPMNRWALAAMQTLLGVVNRVHRRRFKSALTHTTIPSSDGHRIPTLIIRPEHSGPALPALVYYHGGAFVMKPAPQHLENAVRYAREAACVVVFVEYRLAPKYVFPAGFNDCYTALLWTISNASSLGVDATRIAVGGDSAGGGLAAGVVQRALEEDRVAVRGQMLIYPAVDLLCTRPSITSFADVPPFKRLPALRIAEAYLGHPLPSVMPRYASPLSGDLAGLVPAYVEIPEFDPLHDQGIAYARALADKGVVVDLNEIKGGVHGFDLLAANSGISNEAMGRRVRFLRHVLASRADVFQLR
jgi:acetyl esterase